MLIGVSTHLNEAVIAVQPLFRWAVQRSRMIWAHRFILIGYLCNSIAAWMLVRKATRAAYVLLAIGCTLLLLGGAIEQHR
jgi:hypothetical protein